MITRVEIDHITVFRKLKAEFSPGVNVLIGENGTGKTHLMKLLYTVCSLENASETSTAEQKLMTYFLPDRVGRLITRVRGRAKGGFKVWRRTEDKAERSVSVELTSQDRVTCSSDGWQTDNPGQAVYIPVKDMLANAPGFTSLYTNHAIHFEGVYADIISKALYPPARGPRSEIQKELLDLLESEIGGSVSKQGEEFYLNGDDGSGNLEFTLLAEGYRKLGLLFCLVQNEMLTKNSILFWDEPEANLNPKLMELVVKILRKLASLGVQIFITTHDSMLTSQLRFLEGECDLCYHLFSKSSRGGVDYNRFHHLVDMVEKNPIQEAYDDLLIKQINEDLNL